jgi:hypothetical protein
MKTLLLTLTIILCTIFTINSQIINSNFQVVENNDSGYTVRLQLSIQGDPAIMGNSVIRFSYDTNSVYFPQNPVENKDFSIYNLSGSNYVYSVSHPSSNTISINIALLTGTGITITTDTIGIATIYFKKLVASNLLIIQHTLIQFFCPNSSSQWSMGTWNDGEDALPVELTSWTASVSGNNVELNWNTATEVNNYGFEIQRKDGTSEVWNKIAFIKGNGNSNSPKVYNYIEKNVNSGKYYYRLIQIDLDGSFKYSNVIEETVSGPNNFELSQNYPNPFNPSTKINYSVSQKSDVQIIIYDILGNKVKELINREVEAGNYTAEFNAANLSSGIYFYRLQAGNFVDTKKMTLLK